MDVSISGYLALADFTASLEPNHDGITIGSSSQRVYLRLQFLRIPLLSRPPRLGYIPLLPPVTGPLGQPCSQIATNPADNGFNSPYQSLWKQENTQRIYIAHIFANNGFTLSGSARFFIGHDSDAGLVKNISHA